MSRSDDGFDISISITSPRHIYYITARHAATNAIVSTDNSITIDVASACVTDFRWLHALSKPNIVYSPFFENFKYYKYGSTQKPMATAKVAMTTSTKQITRLMPGISRPFIFKVLLSKNFGLAFQKRTP